MDEQRYTISEARQIFADAALLDEAQAFINNNEPDSKRVKLVTRLRDRLVALLPDDTFSDWC